MIFIGSFGAQIFTAQNRVTHVAACLIVVGAGYLLYRLISDRRQAPDQSLTEGEPQICAAFYRSELERQRDFHRRIWVWSPVVFLSSALVILLPMRRFTTWQFTVTMITLVAFLIAAGVAGNLWQAREYQRELDELNARSDQ
ncbi:MAG: hypothetical protein ACRDFS_10615 [Chloroflexota bacterium]